MSTNLYQAHAQWASRPADQRYASLGDLKQAVSRRREQSWTQVQQVQRLRAVATDEVGSLRVQVYNSVVDQVQALQPTHFSFGQLCQYAKAPASFLRGLPDQLAAINLQWQLEHDAIREGALVLGQTNGDNYLRAMTSATYGRIWDQQVVEAVEHVNQDGRWVIPAASYQNSDPLRATTLYASDRDVWMFLVDPDHPIEVNGDVLFRGFITWNSEVGDAVFGLMTFLYRLVCDNRIIWDVSGVRELRIRHTGGAPDRFAYEGARYLKQYSVESPLAIQQRILAAKTMDAPIEKKPGVPQTEATRKLGLTDWLQERGFNKTQATGAIDAARQAGSDRSLWDIINGVTAYARGIQNTNDRVQVEQRAGSLMKLAQPTATTSYPSAA